MTAKTFVPTSENILFTGQPYVNNLQEVACTKCGRLTSGFRGWYDSYQDPHNTGGTYVHIECLSKERRDEISRMR